MSVSGTLSCKQYVWIDAYTTDETKYKEVPQIQIDPSGVLYQMHGRKSDGFQLSKPHMDKPENP